MCNHPINQRKGQTLKNPKAHSKDHNLWSRRSFLSTLGTLGASSLLLNKIPLQTFAASPMTALLNSSENDRVLIIIRLRGGNDSLNMVVPSGEYGIYQNKRPTIAIPQNELFDLGEGFSLPNFMVNAEKSNLQAMWNEGKMSVVHAVGYPNPSASHFDGERNWSSASDGIGAPLNYGWMGRYLQTEFPNFLENLPQNPPAIHIGFNNDRMFDTDMGNISYLIRSLSDLDQIIESGSLYDSNDVPSCIYGEALGIARSVANGAQTYTTQIKDAYDLGITSGSFEYPSDVNWAGKYLGSQLHLIANLIKGGLGTKVYMVDMGGFDTHYSQNLTHQCLLSHIAEAVSVFYEDLTASNLDSKVLTLTISEFGRTFHENSSQGTDHGSAAAMLMFGGGLENAGFFGPPPNLAQLESNNAHALEWHTDYRDIYNSVLENWLCVDTTLLNGLMGGTFTTVNGLILPCSAIGDGTPIGAFRLHAKVFLEGAYEGNGEMRVSLTNVLPTNQPFNIAPYHYDGTENLSNVADTMVDWVLVEARSGTPNTSGNRATVTVETRAGILLASGDIVDVDGNPLAFSSLTAGESYHFCIRHRNHLDIFTANPTIASEDMFYDFTISPDQALGTFQQKVFMDGKAMMYAGDFTQDGTIQVSDYDAWSNNPAQLDVYTNTDGNLDGVVQNTDADTWYPNKAKLGIVEIGF